MDKTPKSKFFGFKSKANASDSTSASNIRSISKNEVCDLQRLPISPDVIQTSPMPVTRINKSNHSAIGLSSPQFIVGWNDGAEKNNIDMNSPIRSVHVERKIRRCPDNLVFKAPKSRVEDNSEGAILKCIDWAKNLFESTNSEKEELPDAKENVTVSENETKDISVDILDDSVDEIMILCSQAVEESHPISRHSPSFPITSNTHGKHQITPQTDESRAKRLKVDCSSDNRVANIEQSLKKDIVSICRNSTNINNNDIVEEKNEFTKPFDKSIKKSSVNSEPKKSNSAVITNTSSNISCSSGSSAFMDDDDDELFGSFDFHAIDKLQNNFNKKVPIKSFGSHSNVAAPLKSNLNRPVPKYTKEQIEQRRLDAKKRLMFKRKNKTV